MSGSVVIQGIEFDTVLDARGLSCPEPMMLLHRKIREVSCGTVVQVKATDPSTERDIARLCTHLGHELLGVTKENKSLVIYIRVCKGET